MPQEVLLLTLFGSTAEPKIHHAGQLRRGQRFAPDRLQHFGLVALRQPHDLPRRRRRQQAPRRSSLALAPEPLDQRQHTQLLCRPNNSARFSPWIAALAARSSASCWNGLLACRLRTYPIWVSFVFAFALRYRSPRTKP